MFSTLAKVKLFFVQGRESKNEGDKGTIEALEMDLSSLDSVRKLADELIKRGDPVHGLILNAGTGMVEPGLATKDG